MSARRAQASDRASRALARSRNARTMSEEAAPEVGQRRATTQARREESTPAQCLPGTLPQPVHQHQEPQTQERVQAHRLPGDVGESKREETLDRCDTPPAPPNTMRQGTATETIPHETSIGVSATGLIGDSSRVRASQSDNKESSAERHTNSPDRLAYQPTTSWTPLRFGGVPPRKDMPPVTIVPAVPARREPMVNEGGERKSRSPYQQQRGVELPSRIPPRGMELPSPALPQGVEPPRLSLSSMELPGPSTSKELPGPWTSELPIHSTIYKAQALRG